MVKKFLIKFDFLCTNSFSIFHITELDQGFMKGKNLDCMFGNYVKIKQIPNKSE